MNNRFKRGSGVFKCRDCGKMTRDVNGNADVGMCALCNTKAENGNSLSDSGYEGDAWAVFADCRTVQECHDLLTAELGHLRERSLTSDPDGRP